MKEGFNYCIFLKNKLMKQDFNNY